MASHTFLAVACVICLGAVLTFCRSAIAIPLQDTTPQHYNVRSPPFRRSIAEATNSKMSTKTRNDVARTIAEVQKVLASDPTLPRLTKGEIADLFETVAQEELAKSLMVGDHKRAKQMRALMVVLPFSTSGNDNVNTLEQLYTKAPVTKLIDNEPPSLLTGRTQSTKTDTTTTTPAPLIAQPETGATLPRRPSSSFNTPSPQIEIPNDLQDFIDNVQRDSQMQSTMGTRTDKVVPSKDIEDVLKSLGLWEESERPMEFEPPAKSTVPPSQLDLSQLYVEKKVEPPQAPPIDLSQFYVERNPAPPVSSDGFVAFKPIPKIEESELNGESLDLLRSLGDYYLKDGRSLDDNDSSKSKLSHISKKAHGFSKPNKHQTGDNSRENQLTDVLKRLEIMNQRGPNPVENVEEQMKRNSVKRQQTTMTSPETVEFPTKFSFDLLTNLTENTQQLTAVNVTATSDDNVRTLLTETEGRILNKDAMTADSTTTSDDSRDSDAVTLPTTTTTTSSSPFSLEPFIDTEGLDPITEGPAPPVKKNGFYFLADWNSFLEVGEGKERVEVRFTPKVGDARLFVPVTIP